jgi:hypothetical protein
MKSIQRKRITRPLFARQRGFSMLQWLVILVVAVFFMLFAFKIVPLYSENLYVVSALKSLQDSGTRLNDMSDMEIKRKLDNFYIINNVRSEGPTKSLKIDRSNNKVLVKIDYETRVNFMMNIDLVMVFKNHLDSENAEMCCKPLPGNASK